MNERRVGAIPSTIKGKLVGFTKRWNPFATEIFALVEVDAKVINVPIDYRQQKYIQMEHPIHSIVPLIYMEGKWQITSKAAAVEHKMYIDSKTIF